MLPLRTLLSLALAAPLLVGCGPNVRKPKLFDPGNAATQRYDAIFHDPYPMPDVAPEIVGGRPRGYQAPVPEVARGRGLQPITPGVAPPPR